MAAPSFLGHQLLSLSGDAANVVLKFVPAAGLISLRRADAIFHCLISDLLKSDPTLRHQLEAHILSIHANAPCVWVAVRAKPLEEGTTGCLRIEGQSVATLSTQVLPSSNPRFFYDRVFDSTASQHDVWNGMAGQVMRCMHRREHACLLVYGQTGSGKTHTMFGDPSVQGGEGLAYQTVRGMARMMRNASANGTSLQVDFTFVEVYNEKVYDLLNNQMPLTLKVERDIRVVGSAYRPTMFGDDERVVPHGVSRRQCDQDRIEQQVIAWLREGTEARTVGKTVFNPRSSRSHAIATLHLRWTDAAQQPSDMPGELDVCAAREVRLYLVDLAGSERAGEFALCSEQLQEGANINKSLSTLGRVVASLVRGKGEHVPYRDSTLTWMLSDAITGRKARTFMVATVNPKHRAESLSTLRYAHDYSALQSNLGNRIAKVTQQVCCLKERVKRAKYDVDSILDRLQTNRVILPTPLGTGRLVKAKRDVRKVFHAHRRTCKWTDRHDTKSGPTDIGFVLSSNTGMPPRDRGDPPDGRPLRTANDDAEAQQPARTPDVLAVAEVVFPGRHGWPDTVLWYPEEALETVRLPAELVLKLRCLQQAEAELAPCQAELSILLVKFVDQQREWNTVY